MGEFRFRFDTSIARCAPKGDDPDQTARSVVGSKRDPVD